jgi:hypothetical protein
MAEMHFTVVAADGRLVVGDAEIARSAPRRMRGLLGRDHLGDDGGLWIEPAPSVHTCFMRFPIDVVFLDGDHRVVKVADGLRPWRAAAARHARVALELPEGAAARRGLRIGEQLSLQAHVVVGQ